MSVAHADSAPQPWVVGVTDAQKAEAHARLDAGNALFLDKKYAEALEQYKAAVAAWNHPAIRFNIVRALIQLDRVVEAADNLKLALAYGAAPLEEAVYAEALAYEKLLANQIGELVVTCTQPGVRVTLDGQPVATCPASETRRVVPGRHQLVGTRTGLLTKSTEVIAVGGHPVTAAIELARPESAARIEHRWPGYLPWVVFGAGFGVAGIGGLLDLAAKSDRDSYDLVVAQRCTTSTCTPSQLADVQHLKDSAHAKAILGGSALVVGGAAIATGAVMLYLNRGRTVYPDVAPIAGGGAAVSLSGRF